MVYRGVKEISLAVGINHQKFRYYVDHLGLPAFKLHRESNVWHASHEDLVAWIEERKQAYFNGT